VNRLLDVNTSMLAQHSPEFLSPIQLPMNFDPSARCPNWDDFVATTFPLDAEAIAWEVPAWLMTPETSIQKAILLTGDGSNGKSVYLAAPLAFIGRKNAAPSASTNWRMTASAWLGWWGNWRTSARTS
jgi:putative DNA primase/helicase